MKRIKLYYRIVLWCLATAIIQQQYRSNKVFAEDSDETYIIMNRLVILSAIFVSLIIWGCYEVKKG